MYREQVGGVDTNEGFVPMKSVQGSHYEQVCKTVAYRYGDC